MARRIGRFPQLDHPCVVTIGADEGAAKIAIGCERPLSTHARALETPFLKEEKGKDGNQTSSKRKRERTRAAEIFEFGDFPTVQFVLGELARTETLTPTFAASTPSDETLARIRGIHGRPGFEARTIADGFDLSSHLVSDTVSGTYA